MNKEDKAFTTRLPKDLVDRIDALAPFVGDLPEFVTKVHIARSDILRVCIAQGVIQLERKAKAKK